MKLVDLTGKSFGNLTVIERAENIGRQTAWLCECTCGNEVVVQGNSLKTGNTKSCGCVRNGLSSERLTTHGESKSRLYRIWKLMRSRCTNKSVERYSNYGGRGIFVCDDWSNNFESFKEWALSNGYTGSLSIDRIDVNGNYEPSNCRWVSMKEQSRNTTRSVLVTFNGETKCVSEWSEITGIPSSTLYWRLSRGWCVEDALTVPVKRINKKMMA